MALDDLGNYRINLFWSDEDECWIADIPDLKFCSAHGERAEEALREVMQAREAWLASARAHKRAIPKPRYRPEIYAKSNKVSITVERQFLLSQSTARRV